LVVWPRSIACSLVRPPRRRWTVGVQLVDLVRHALEVGTTVSGEGGLARHGRVYRRDRYRQNLNGWRRAVGTLYIPFRISAENVWPCCMGTQTLPKRRSVNGPRLARALAIPNLSNLGSRW
jgi:hypothetical protein